MLQEYSRLTPHHIKEHFGFRKQYCENLCSIIMSSQQAQTTNLAAMSRVVQSKIQIDSIYKKYCRTLRGIELDPEKTVCFIDNFLDFDFKDCVLILDRTYWQYGKTHLNFLVLSVIHNGVGVPLFITLCGPDKKGNSSIDDRKILLEAFINVFGKGVIGCLMGDREFIGHDWIEYLKKEEIPYVMRLKEYGTLISNAKGEMKKATQLCQNVSYGEEHQLGLRTIGGAKPHKSYVSVIKIKAPDPLEEPSENEKKAPVKKNNRGQKNGKAKANARLKIEQKEAAKNGECIKEKNIGEPELVVLCHSPDIGNPCELYRSRWTIEMCFRSLKTYGFNIEDTSITDPKRLIILMRIMMISFAIALRVGFEAHKIKPITIKKHGYKAITFLKYGLNLIERFLVNNFVKILNLKNVLKSVKPCIYAG